MPKTPQGCVEPAAGPLVSSSAPPTNTTTPSFVPQEDTMQARVGKEAPDFEASAFVPGEGFKNVKLSDYKGQWIVLCFYPGDFTFV